MPEASPSDYTRLGLEDPKRRFSETAERYGRWRPSYPAALVDWIVLGSGLRPGGAVADIGCGTGISTRVFAERGYGVVGVEPNPEMLSKALGAGGARYVRGEASATGLPSNSADLVIAAQAFHWFPLGETLAEFARILKPGGSCAAFWNIRDRTTPLMRAYDELLRRFSSEYAVLGKPEAAIAALKASPLVTAPREAEFPSVQRLELEGFLGRVYSSSYVAHGVGDAQGFDRELRSVFATHQSGGAVEFAYRSAAVSFRPASG